MASSLRDVTSLRCQCPSPASVHDADVETCYMIFFFLQLLTSRYEHHWTSVSVFICLTEQKWNRDREVVRELLIHERTFPAMFVYSIRCTPNPWPTFGTLRTSKDLIDYIIHYEINWRGFGSIAGALSPRKEGWISPAHNQCISEAESRSPVTQNPCNGSPFHGARESRPPLSDLSVPSACRPKQPGSVPSSLTSSVLRSIRAVWGWWWWWNWIDHTHTPRQGRFTG